MPPSPSLSSSSSLASMLPTSQTSRAGLRVSQRPPTACRECSQRKVRCDKQTPCGRCVRLSRRCTREVVRISKSLSLHRDELRFLRSLRVRLAAGGEQRLDPRDAVRLDAVADIDARIHVLEHGKSTLAAEESHAGTDEEDGEAHMRSPSATATATTADDGPPVSEHYHGGGGLMAASPTALAAGPAAASASASPTPSSARMERTATQKLLSSMELGVRDGRHGHHGRGDSGDSHGNSKATILTGFEFLAWGRYSQTCFPHRRCHCYQNRRYSELASINCDPAWIGRQAMSLRVDPDVLLPPAVASKVIEFHMDHLRWHHNAFHGPTFLAKCRQFWSTGTADHPLWLALYFAVCSVSLWTLLNNEQHRTAALGGLFAFDETLVERQFQAMVNTLYAENFVENLSLYAVQAIVISTRIAHNLDRTDLNAILVGAAVRIAHCLGLHKISDPPVDAGSPGDAAMRFNWHERVEIETGKRVWLQLLIQDHFQIPYTDTYIINPSQYMTPLPKNCDDQNMIEQDIGVATNSSYTRMLGRTASLMPSLLDGLGPMSARKTPREAYQHILACDRMMRANVTQIPEFLLRDDQTSAAASSRSATGHAAENRCGNAAVPWLPLARRTLAISAAEKIIMIHRPVLFDSFQTEAFRPTRATCVAAATTILREHEQAVAEQALSIWTHSAFCVTAAVVLGLELFHRTDHTDETAHTQRQMMARAADRLRRRRCDAIAKRGALLIDTMLAAEEDLVLRMMRTSRTASSVTTVEAHQQAIINDMLGSHEIMARFLAVAPPPKAATAETASVASTPLMSLPGAVPSGFGSMDSSGGDGSGGGSMSALLASVDLDTGQDFDAWFNNVFAPVYDPLL